MEDSVRPNHFAFESAYKQAYRTWYNLNHQLTTGDEASDSVHECLAQLKNAFPDYPSFPTDLLLNASFSNTVLVTGISSWKAATGSCDIPPFTQSFPIPIATDDPTILSISDTHHDEVYSSLLEDNEDSHFTVLVLAWTYILAARWAEIFYHTATCRYSDHRAEWDDEDSSARRADVNSTMIHLGDVDDDAARWWAAVLAVDGGWDATMPNDRGRLLHSPWYTKVSSNTHFILSRTAIFEPPPIQYRPASFVSALRYLDRYCEIHQLAQQNQAALAATLLIPVAKFDRSIVQLPIPKIRSKIRCHGAQLYSSDWNAHRNQIDKLLTLSCNAPGVKALLTSIFFEPSIACNLCGPWLRGTLAFLGSETAKDHRTLLRILIKRDPNIGFLWAGAFFTGTYKRALRDARLGWWKIDLHVAAWTGTLMSFIQEPVSSTSHGEDGISRADECRLMYLCHDQPYTNPPLFPFAPFGSTALRDTNLDVRQHAQCGVAHVLRYENLTWKCRGNQTVVVTIPENPPRAKRGDVASGNILIPSEDVDDEIDDCSEMVTRNIFTWMRDIDGFPVAERAIREHEWIDNLDSDDDSPITGDALSTAGGNLHGWLLKTSTKRSNSL